VQLDEIRALLLASLESLPEAERQLVGLSADAKHALELSVAEANRLQHHYVGTEHLLLGLVAEGHGGAADILRQRNAGDLGELRSHILRVLTEGGPYLRPPT
jgi:ATP-dependent Clp protease ATP-binding subunit ClpC